MREIKYRMWNPETKVMVDLKKITPLAVHPEVLKEGLDGLFIPFKEGYPLIQFTGLRDKNGKEIWEKDILRGHVTGILYIVFFEDGAYFARSGNLLLTRQDFHNNEVIGNIYENPELLEATDCGKRIEVKDANSK